MALRATGSAFDLMSRWTEGVDLVTEAPRTDRSTDEEVSAPGRARRCEVAAHQDAVEIRSTCEPDRPPAFGSADTEPRGVRGSP